MKTFFLKPDPSGFLLWEGSVKLKISSGIPTPRGSDINTWKQKEGKWPHMEAVMGMPGHHQKSNALKARRAGDLAGWD